MPEPELTPEERRELEAYRAIVRSSERQSSSRSAWSCGSPATSYFTGYDWIRETLSRP